MTSEGLGVMFEGESPDMCGGKFRLMLMGSRIFNLMVLALSWNSLVLINFDRFLKVDFK